MEGISKERLLELAAQFDKPYSRLNEGLILTLIKECKELNPWLSIETAPKDKPGFLALSIHRESIEWLVDHGEEDRFYNVNSNNYTDKRHWSHWQELPEDPK